MSDAQQMIALVIFAWIGLACVFGATAVAFYSLVQLAVHWVSELRSRSA